MKYANDRRVQKSLRRIPGRQSNVGRDPRGGRGDVPLERPVTSVTGSAYFDGFGMQAKKRGHHQGRASAGVSRRLHHDRSHQPGRRYPPDLTRRSQPAGARLSIADFKYLRARRGNHEVMMRGTFASPHPRTYVRGKAESPPQPSGEQMVDLRSSHEVQGVGVSSVVFGGDEYGKGSSRDWAAKGPQLLGVKAVIVRNSSGFTARNSSSWAYAAPVPGRRERSVAEDRRLGNDRPRGLGERHTRRAGCDDDHPSQNGETATAPLRLRIDTPIEVDYYQHGGILPYVMRELLA